MQTLGDIEPYQQREQYSCGAATLKAVLKNYGTDYDERMLIKLVGVDPKSGSSAAQVASAARRLGYDAQPLRFDSIDELATYTNDDIPVIVAIRSFNRPDQGHFVIADEIDDTYVHIMDPNVRGNRRSVTRHELDQRWLFRDRTGDRITPRGQLGRALARRRTSWRGAFGAGLDRTKAAWVAAGVGVAAAVTTAVLVVRRRRALGIG